MTADPIEVDVYVADDAAPSTAYDVSGGVRVRVDGRRLHRFEGEESMSFEDWGPEYVGSRLHGDLLELVTLTADLADGAVDLYSTEAVQLGGLSSRFVFEPLSPGSVRVAFRATADRQRGDHPVVPRAACGLPVDTLELASEVLDSGETYLRVLGGHGLRAGQLGQGFEGALEDLSNAIDRREGDV